MTAPALDHLILLVPDREAACDDLERRLGVRPAIGGRHPQYGTHNALLSLGPTTYLEVMAHDASSPAPPEGVLFGADTLDAPRLVTWVLAVDDARVGAARAAEAGVDLGEASEGRRERPDGQVVSWCLTDPRADRFGGVLPFLISWGDTLHPASSAPPAGALEALEVGHPEPRRVADALAALGFEHPVVESPHPRLRATIATPHGAVTIG